MEGRPDDGVGGHLIVGQDFSSLQMGPFQLPLGFCPPMPLSSSTDTEGSHVASCHLED